MCGTHFRGLRAFDMDMSRVSFGRRAEVNEVAEPLRVLADRTDRAGAGRVVPVMGTPERRRKMIRSSDRTVASGPAATPDHVRTVLSGHRIGAFVVLFFGLWTAAWLGYRAIGDHFGLSGQPLRELAYWAVVKCLVWVVFPLYFWGGRRAATRAGLAEQLNFIGLRRDTVGSGLVFGAGFTAIWLAVSLAQAVFGRMSVVTTAIGVVGAYTIVATPVFEEILFRGYLQSTLVANGIRFAYVNVIGAVLFLLIHCLGWSFQGTLVTNLLSAYPASLTVVSLLLGYVRHRSGSLLASIMLHMGNNAFSAFVKP